MIEKKVLDFLSERSRVPVLMERPEEKIEEYVLLEKTGSSNVDFINSATIAIQSYGNSLYKASALNEEIKKVMTSLLELPEISRVRLNTDYNFTDTKTKQYRYQAVYDITY